MSIPKEQDSDIHSPLRTANRLRSKLGQLREKTRIVSDNNSECIKCGSCCRGLFIFVTPADLVREPLLEKAVSRLKNRPQEQEVFGEYSNKYLLAAGWAIPCPMQADNGLCTIYDTRPDACRQWQPHAESCEKLREKLAGIK
ncbi:MAG: YkgJ family cysteine cluster protein [Sedimentisphaerales bacterium]|nr:YkgJ family cysteine cluster protein [Sedimentisphaerales bacterium]